MSSSGGVTGNNVDGSEYSYLNWQVATQEVDNNRSLINWQAGWHFTTYSCRGLRQGSAYINGTLVYYDYDAGDGVHDYNSGHDHRPALQTASGSLWIGHGGDGTATITPVVDMRAFGTPSSSYGTNSDSLPTIPRFTSAPSTPVVSSITDTSAFVTFTDGTGGAAIDSRELLLRVDHPFIPSAEYYISSDGSTLLTPLAPGTNYYVFARTHNSAGWSDFSLYEAFTTLRIPDAPSAPSIWTFDQTSAVIAWAAPYDGGTAITSYQTAINTSNTTSGATIVTASSPKTYTGLTPGTKYYFFVRANNSVGNGPWSVSSNATMIAGARVLDGGVWKQAVPYVKDSGVWKLARAWTKSLGVWKEDI